VDRRVKVGIAELSYYAAPNLALDYVFESERLGIWWSAQGYPDLLTRHMMFEGLYQEDVLECIETLARKGDVVFDVGGHHGLMAVIASKAVGAAGRVITFEPNPVARQFLAESLRINGAENVQIEPIGLHAEEGSFDFYVQEGRRVSWNSSFVKEFVDAEGTATRVKVRTLTLDSYVRESKLRPSLVKIDTEGTEMHILLGAKETIEKYRPSLVVEMNAASAHRAKTSIGEMVRFLHAHSYDLFVLKRLRNGHYRYEYRDEFDEERHCRRKLVNVACVPKK
jgi:FkbM family methyltransferase